MVTSKKGLEMTSFEILWDSLGEKEKIALIDDAAEQGPEVAIAPVLKGLDTHQFSVRSHSRNTLNYIRKKVRNLVSDPSDVNRYSEGMKSCACICAQIFSKIMPGAPFEEQQYYFKLLLSFESTGADHAFKAVYLKLIDIRMVQKIILAAPEDDRLRFIGAYLKADPGVRLLFGPICKKIIASVKDPDTVTEFYARLFDIRQDIDPFLNNIDPAVRNPDRVSAKGMTSKSPAVRALSLKALAMMLPKVDASLLLSIIETESDFKVRQAAYQVIENAALGTYTEVFDPLLALLEKKDEQEAFFAFKALIVTGKRPLHKVLSIIRQKQPHLIGHICQEISELSKISFYFLQDIALNPKIYLQHHLDINLAAIFGMIKKRPERVVKILENAAASRNNANLKHLTNFTKKTRQILKKEKKSIVAHFAATARQAGNQSPENSGFLKKIFSSTTLSKKLDKLKTGSMDAPLTLDKETIMDSDLSGIVLNKFSASFNLAIIKNSNMSGARIFNAYFKGALIINTDFSDTIFDSVCFENAVFINVNARDTKFKNCSFLNISVCNCIFDNALMPGAFFIGATIAKCRFENTTLCGASFAFSRIDAVSFETTNLDQVDFSSVQARFCRFPSHARAAVTGEDANLNARRYQLDSADMPLLDTNLVSRINMLIFSEFIHFGEYKFLRQNKLCLLTAFDIFKPRQADLFTIIPYLLHKNICLPGFTSECDPQTPHGIHDFYEDPHMLTIVTKYSLGTKPSTTTQQLAIEGLYTIGSVGSVAQTDDSDIDYWVCVQKELLTGKGLHLLEEKLRILETYAKDRFHIQVTFFIVDVDDARQNQFGGFSGESSGSAQAMLLKEEFYRTMIHVAGKLPLWSVLPTAISKNHYTGIRDTIVAFRDLGRYIDLGDIHTIPAGEFFGATIWQLFKGLKSPFKSVIKMALLEKTIREAGKRPLLCNSVKDSWMNSGVNLLPAQNDSYYILLRELIGYYIGIGEGKSVSMMLTCFFLKLGIADDAAMTKTVFGFRGMLLAKCLEEWKWSRQGLFRTGNWKSWPYKNIAKLSAGIETFMVNRYKIVNNTFNDSGSSEINISPEDRTVLGRKVYSELAKQPGKITKVLLISDRDTHFHGLHITYVPGPDTTCTWTLTSGGQAKSGRTADTVLQTKTIEEIGAWMILNHVWHESVIVNMIPNPTRVTVDDIQRMFGAMNSYFSPLLTAQVHFDQLLEKSRLAALFVSVNSYAPRQQQAITDYCAIWMNTWGEMFVESWASSKGISSMDEMVIQLKHRLDNAPFPANTLYYTRGKPRLFNLYK